MASILKVDTIQDQDGNNIINENAGTITIGKSGDTVNLASGATAGFGKVLQVVSANKTDAFSTTSTSFVDVTGLSVSITPASSSNKIYIVATVYMSSEDAPNQLTLVRNSTSIQSFQDYADYSTSGAYGSSMSCSYLDSPSTTSATTYKLQIKSDSGNNAKVNQRWDSGAADIGDSTITVMEIEA